MFYIALRADIRCLLVRALGTTTGVPEYNIRPTGLCARCNKMLQLTQGI
jgi:hypothetical protein